MTVLAASMIHLAYKLCGVQRFRPSRRNKKSPPPERTPATGSCSYLMAGAADTLSTALNLARVVAQFQEEKGLFFLVPTLRVGTRRRGRSASA
jgi:hypothetical protein